MGEDSLYIFLKEVGKHKLLTIEEERELLSKSKYDKKSFDTLVKCNLRFVVNECKKFVTPEFPLPDLIQEGVIGLMRAIEKFDITRPKKEKLITYAVYWIRHKILYAMQHKRKMVRIPANKEKEMNKLKKFKVSFYQLQNREPTIDEIKKATGKSFQYLEELESMQNTQWVQIDKINQNEATYTIENEVDKCIISEKLINEIKKILPTLGEKHSKIISMLYGINENFRVYTICEVAKLYNVSKTRINQIRDECFILMKKNFSYLKNFL